MIRNLGWALTVLARADATEHNLHADVDVYQAPSECHDLVSKYEHLRRRRARRKVEASTNRPLRVIKREAVKRGLKPKHFLRLISHYIND